MLPVNVQGTHGPLLVMLHWLGGGAQTWREVGAGLAGRGVRFVALDLPGFGEASDITPTDVTTTADAVIETIRSLRGTDAIGPWVVGGHSMGGKIAAVIARRALDGEAGLEGLRGIVLVSPSPPSPEPIREARREEHLQNFGETTPDPNELRELAEGWVDGNTGKPALAPAVRERAIEGVLAIPPRSFRAWFLNGSKEDWSDRVGKLPIPALLFVGTEETSLGEDAQRKYTLPHLPKAELVILQGAKHLAPLERTGELVEHITTFLAGHGLQLPTRESRPSSATEALMHSDRTSPATLGIMDSRLQRSRNWNHKPRTFTPGEFRLLRALAQCVIPDAGFDLAACVDEQLAANKGDGWRYATLPADPEAWKRGLLSLDAAADRNEGIGFVALSSDRQISLLRQVAEGKIGHGLLGALHLGQAADAFSAEDLQRWFEDARAELTRFYVADPRTMDRIGYTGFADDLGFTQIQLGQQEEFER